MTPKYHSFQDLPTKVAEMLKERIVEGEERNYPTIPKDASTEERMCALEEAFKNSALAVADTMYKNKVEKKISKKIEIYGKDEGSLLYNFLDLLFVH